MLNNKIYLILLLISFLGISILSAQTDRLDVNGNARIYGKFNLRDNALNVFIGDVGSASQQAIRNILIGNGLYKNEESGQIAIGFGVLADNIVGETNIGVGGSSLSSNFQGSYNTALGSQGLFSNFSGNYNTALGYRAFYDGQFFSNSTALGARAVITTSNQIRLGDANIISIGGYATWTNLSDKRLKKNIKKDIPGLEFITQLHPVSYQLDMESIAKWHETPDSLRDFKSEAVKGNIRYSVFLAQEVEETA